MRLLLRLGEKGAEGFPLAKTPFLVINELLDTYEVGTAHPGSFTARLTLTSCTDGDRQ